MKSYDLGKILSGGAVDYKIGNPESLDAGNCRDVRDQILVTNANKKIEIVVSNTSRWNDLISMPFNHISLDDILSKGAE